MAAPQRLGEGKLTASAQPVSTFMSYDARSTPATPARLPQMPNVQRVTAFQRGGMRDVQGVNSAQELSEALAPLTKLYDAGAQMYASDQYRRGQNEILKAAANINRDQQVKSLAYAQENRELSTSNPIAGVLMDRANPFRQAGRVNQASQYVASLAQQQFKAEWAKSGSSLRKLDPGDPLVMATQAKVTNRLTQAYGLDEFSPGFQQYVAPAINRGWEWFQNEQYKAASNYQKEAGLVQTADVLTSLLTKTTRPSVQDWESALTSAAARYGLAGEPQKMTRDAILATHARLREMATNPATRQTAGRALLHLQAMPSGLYREDGSPISVGEAYGPELLEDYAAVTRDIKTIRDNREAQQLDAAERDPVLDQAAGYGANSPEFGIAWEELRRNPKYSDLSDAQLRELLIERSKQNEEWESVTYDSQQVDDFFREQSDAFGSDWNESEANQRFRELNSTAPESVRQANRERYERLRENKRSEQRGEIDQTIMNNQVNRRVEALIAEKFPEKGAGLLRWMQENPGRNVVEYLGEVDARTKALVSAAQTEYRQAGLARIREVTAEEGAQLRPERQLQIWNDVWKELESTLAPVPEAPGGGGQPSNEQSSAKPAAPTYYNPGQTIPQEAATGNVPVYNRTTTLSLLSLAANQQALPATVKRAAISAGMTPGEFVLKQADLLGLEVPQPMRRKIQRQSNRSMGFEMSVIAMSPGSGPLSQSTGVVLDILTGSAPSYSRSTAG